MPKAPPPYPPEFRRRILDLVRSGRTPESLGREFKIAGQTVRNWMHEEAVETGRRKDGLTHDEREELNRLRRENRRLLQEREVLKKAAIWFAKEGEAAPKRDSSS
jgi:transposase